VKIPVHVVVDPDFWRTRRVLVSGHTGFKGAWLCLWLQSVGAHVVGFAPGAPTRPSLFELARVGDHMTQHHADVRDARAVLEIVNSTKPEVVFHLAAQPMVRRSLLEPALTYEVNVMGTVNLLEAIRSGAAGVRAVVVVTSDKCYANDGKPRTGFLEDDPLGGADPYSSSKACAELVAAAYRRSFFDSAGPPQLATARAGNLIGGGDWGEDRLLADAVRAVETGAPLRLRNPSAVRPWQHVLNALSGYLLLAEALCERPRLAGAWNFGPAAGEARTVAWLIERLAQLWDGDLRWEPDERPGPAEASYLALDSAAAERDLGWQPPWDLDKALQMLVSWDRARRAGEDVRAVSLAQLDEFAAASPDRTALGAASR
jgi:CDP-glucose 4,6-dehydratase